MNKINHRSLSVQSSALILSGVFLLSACSGSSSESQQMSETPVPPINVPPPVTPPTTTPVSSVLIKANQFGYLPSQQKTAIVPASTATSFELIDQQTQAQVFSGTLSAASVWGPAAQNVQVADFSDFSQSGTYELRVDGFETVRDIEISNDVYSDVHDAALKAYYFNRASTALDAEYAGVWERPTAHPDDNVRVHASAASAARPEGTVLSAPKGWYDAGDYNKYVVNSGISTFTLLNAYSQFTNYYLAHVGDIPESGNTLPDILDEIKWNLDWKINMQDPNDGGVYHKLTTLGFEGAVMPHEATNQRYMVQKGTGAALNFAATMAKASRVYAAFPETQNDAAAYRAAAISAFAWAQNNPDVPYEQPADVSTGTYEDDDFAGEFAWAASEMFVLTQEPSYYDVVKDNIGMPVVSDWQDAMGLAFISILGDARNIVPDADLAMYQQQFLTLADNITENHRSSAYRVAMQNENFVWGSNGTAMNIAMVAWYAHSISGDDKYLEPVIGMTDYVMGKNPTDYSYITGLGTKPAMNPHHRQSYADTVVAPIPGFLVGGPQPGQQDGCNYQSGLPALSFVDDWCSYASNEVTINWNAPLVFVLAALDSM